MKAQFEPICDNYEDDMREKCGSDFSFKHEKLLMNKEYINPTSVVETMLQELW